MAGKPPKPPGKPPKPPGPGTVKQTWDVGLQKQVSIASTATVIRNKVSGDLKTGSFYDVAEMVYEESDGLHRYLFSGSKFLLQPQISLFNALRDFMKNELKATGSGEKDLDLTEWNRWVEAFEDCYPAVASKPAIYSQAGQPWGLPDRENRPRIIALPAANLGASADKIVAFYPDRNRVDEAHLFAGSYREIRRQIQDLWATLQRLKAQSIGAWVGYPIDQHLRQEPKRGINLMLVLTPERGFPWDKKVSAFANGKPLMLYRSQVCIPFPKRSALDHGILREACGGNAGLNWGHYLARAYISPIPGENQTRGLSQLVARGSTEEVAEANLLRFAALSDGFIVNKSVTIKKFTNEQLSNPRTQATRNYDVYPGWAFIENSKLVAAGDTLPGGTQTGTDESAVLYLNSAVKPAAWDIMLNALLRRDD